MTGTLETRGAPHLARELARFDKWAATDLLQSCGTDSEVNAWLERERCREKRLAVAMFLDTRDRNSRQTLVWVCHQPKFLRHCRAIVEQFPPVKA